MIQRQRPFATQLLRLLGALIAATALACDSQKVLPGLGEVIVIVDTDMPVPGFVSRLRVDLYDGNGAWYDSQDIGREQPSDWPTSFGLYVPDTNGRTVWVRLRAYPEGAVRDYQGERYAPRPTGGPPLSLAPVPPATGQPRLVLDDGTDATPPSEPAPLLAIDRLLLVQVLPGTRSGASVVLRGACVGTMADVVGGNSCVDTENVRVPVVTEPTAPDTSLPATSLSGTYDPGMPCTAAPRPAGKASDGTPLYDEEVCVDGAMFTFGSNDGFGTGAADDLPKRVAILSPFRMDRYEVSVGRWRQALAAGFVPPSPSPLANDGPLATTNTAITDPSVCTWSTAPLGREDYPLNCVTWSGARAFCRFLGGDLPTEAEWEYAGAAAGRPYPTTLPWGGNDYTPVSCGQAVFGRANVTELDDCNPNGTTFGPLPVNARASANGDVSLGVEVVNLLGGVAEMARDAFASFSSNCWASQPLEDPVCFIDGADFTTRGATWSSGAAELFLAQRQSFPFLDYDTEVGFRCVRPGQ